MNNYKLPYMINGVKKVINKTLLVASILLLLLLTSLFIEIMISGIMIAVNNPVTFVSQTRYELDHDSNRLFLIIDVDTPKAGVVQKGIFITYMIQIEDRVHEREDTIYLGDSKLIELEIQLTESNMILANSPEGLQVDIVIWITPIYANIKILAAEREIPIDTIVV